MKNNVLITVLFVLLALTFVSCKSTPKFSDVTGKEWLLVEIKSDTQGLTFDRKNLKNEGFGEIFTLNFDGERISGVGAPNRYTAPFKVEKNQVISIKLVASTLMAPIREPERLKEQDYFTYLQNAYKWNFTKEGKFELYSKNKDKAEAVLIFSLGTSK